MSLADDHIPEIELGTSRHLEIVPEPVTSTERYADYGLLIGTLLSKQRRALFGVAPTRVLGAVLATRATRIHGLYRVVQQLDGYSQHANLSRDKQEKSIYNAMKRIDVAEKSGRVVVSAHVTAPLSGVRALDDTYVQLQQSNDPLFQTLEAVRVDRQSAWAGAMSISDFNRLTADAFTLFVPETFNAAVRHKA